MFTDVCSCPEYVRAFIKIGGKREPNSQNKKCFLYDLKREV
jgi:hypothetical protein